MFDSRLPHHAELALWESAGATSRIRWVRFPRSVFMSRWRNWHTRRPQRPGPIGYEGSSPSLDTMPPWRNWHTRQAENLGSARSVRVRVPPVAPRPRERALITPARRAA